MGALIGGLITGIASNLGSNWLENQFHRNDPTALDIFISTFLSLLPQLIALVLMIGVILMYIGIFKNYKLKIGVLLYPIGISILYLIMLQVGAFFSFWIVLAITFVIFVTVVYLRLSFSIFKVKHKFGDSNKILNSVSDILEKDVKKQDKDKTK